MRKLQYEKLRELLNTMQEAAGILSSMNDDDERKNLVLDMIFFVNRIISYAEGIANVDSFVAELKQLREMLALTKVMSLPEKVSKAGVVLDEIKIERTDVEKFHRETDLFCYIDLLLQALEDGYAIMIAAQDTPTGSTRFTEELGEKIQRLGVSINLWDRWRMSYCAVIDGEHVVDEKFSDTYSVSISCVLGKADVFVKSAGMQKVDSTRMCSIKINGCEHAIMHRGLSFVIYDKENDNVIDSVNFDTFSEELFSLRDGILPELKEFMDDASGVVFMNVSYPKFPKENLSKNEKWILEKKIHHSMIRLNPTLPSAISEYIKEPEGVMEVLIPPQSYVGVDGARHFVDYKGKYLNTVNGHRKTLWQPEQFKRTIYIVGGCSILGIGVRDVGTLASQLQKLLNLHASEEAFIVENYAFTLDGMDYQREILAILKSLPLRAGDIVIGIGDKIVSYNQELDERPYRHGELFFDDEHMTETTHGLVAKGVLDTLQKNDFFRESLSGKSSSWQIHKEDYHLSEGQLIELEEYKQKLAGIYAEYASPKEMVGAIVMNCNPFTLGHRYLIETCAKKCDLLFVFVVQEDKSYFPFADRIHLVEEGCRDLENVCVIGSGKFILSSLTFSEYFNKSQLQDRIVDSSEDITLFANEIAPTANIKVRFAGTEPLDKVTNQYNRMMEKILLQHDIQFEEIPRLEKKGNVISASRVRKLLEDRNWKLIRELVPETTFSYLKDKYRR